MKIALLNIHTFRTRRGIETLVISLANALVRPGVEVSILAGGPRVTPLVRPAPDVRVRTFRTGRYYEAPAIVPFYAADLIRQRYDWVIAFFADFGEARALQFAAPFVRPRLALYLTYPIKSAPHRYATFQRWGWGRRADCILADASLTAREGEAFFGRPVAVVPGGTDVARFRPDPVARAALRARLGVAEHEVLLLTVAALEPGKGIARVLRALPALKARRPDVRYLIMGVGSQRAELEALAAAPGLGDTVIFGGSTPDLPPYYAAADVFVLLPDAEAGSIACVEAMASGLPAVVADDGGFADAVTPACGLLVPPDDPAQVLAALDALVADPARRQALGQAARAQVLAHRTWPRAADRLLALLTEKG